MIKEYNRIQSSVSVSNAVISDVVCSVWLINLLHLMYICTLLFLMREFEGARTKTFAYERC